jgi:hypothetical protein
MWYTRIVVGAISCESFLPGGKMFIRDQVLFDAIDHMNVKLFDHLTDLFPWHQYSFRHEQDVPGQEFDDFLLMCMGL